MAGPVYGPFWLIPPPALHGSFHQNLRIFFLRFQHFIFLFSPHPARSTPPASLRSAAPSRRGPAGQRTPQGNVARPALFVARPVPSVARPAPSPPDARPVAGSLRTARVAECQPTLRSERAASAFGQASAFLFQRGDPAATRRCPQPLRAVRQNGPVPCTARLADFAARPARPIPPKSTNIFLEISIVHFPIFAPSRTEYSPSLASLGSPLSEGAGRAADATGERRPSRAIRRPSRALRRPSRALRSPPRAQSARRPVRRGKPQNGPCGGVPALDAKRKGCLRGRPSLRVSIPTRRSGDNAEVPASASRRPAERAGFVYGSFRPIPPPAPRTAHSTIIYEYFS